MKLDAQLRRLALHTADRAREFARRAHVAFMQQRAQLGPRVAEQHIRLTVRAWAFSHSPAGRVLAAPYRRLRVLRWERAARARRDRETQSRLRRAWCARPAPRSSFWDRGRGLG